MAEIPYGEGKVLILKEVLSEFKPIITGSDGEWDRFLLDYTSIDGSRFWLGKDKAEYTELKNTLFNVCAILPY
jgi:hypothetical protein